MQRLMSEDRFAGWHFTYSANHWCNPDTMEEFLSELLVP